MDDLRVFHTDHALLCDGTALLQWQDNAAGWHLEGSFDLDAWTPIGEMLTGAGTLPVTPGPRSPRHFFRLARP
jgi:hypothetical protein